MSDQFLRNVITLLAEERIPGPWAMPEEVSTDQIRAAVDNLVDYALKLDRAIADTPESQGLLMMGLEAMVDNLLALLGIDEDDE
jgi:hypothetical protein